LQQPSVAPPATRHPLAKQDSFLIGSAALHLFSSVCFFGRGCLAIGSGFQPYCAGLPAEIMLLLRRCSTIKQNHSPLTTTAMLILLQWVEYTQISKIELFTGRLSGISTNLYL
jgi:hypothetical protein